MSADGSYAVSMTPRHRSPRLEEDEQSQTIAFQLKLARFATVEVSHSVAQVFVKLRNDFEACLFFETARWSLAKISRSNLQNES